MSFLTRSLKMSHANETFWSVLQTGKAVGLAIGPPGSGKTKTIEAFSKVVDRLPYTLIGSIREPTDFGGFPYPVQCTPVKDPVSGKMVDVYMSMVPPKWAMDMHGTEKSWILFLDELTCNAPAVQAAMLAVITDKRVGDLPLPPETWIVSACNPPDQAANGHELEPPMANRLFHHKWESDKEAWEAGFIGGWDNVVPAFTLLPPDWENGMGRASANLSAFLRRFPSHWEKMPEDRNKRGGPWPSRRTWEMAKIALAAVESHSPREHGLRLQAIAGCVGEDIAHEWSSFDKALDLPDPEVVIQAVMAAMASGRKVNGEVPTLARADQALVFLGALSDRVLHHDFGRERWEAGMEIVHGFWDQWRDLCLAATPPMAREWKAGWKIDQQFMNKALPLLERAGIAKKVVK
jgi:hypothetical protein